MANDDELLAAVTALTKAVDRLAASSPRMSYTLEQAGEQLGGVSAKVVRGLIAKGKLTPIYVGLRQEIPHAELERYIDSAAQDPPDESAA